MTIGSIQKRRVVNEILQKKFSEGRKPTPAYISKEVSSFFANNKIGLPYDIPDDVFRSGAVSDPDLVNYALNTILENLTVYYLSSQEQLGRMLSFGDFSKAKFNQIDDKRQALLRRIEDYLLSIFNSDGYFLSHSDSFRTVEFIDLGLSTAFVNTDLSQVSIPINPNTSVNLGGDQVTLSSVTFYDDDTDEVLHPFKEPGNISNLFDGFDNTTWSYEVRTSKVRNIRCEMNFSVQDGGRGVSKVSLYPYGSTEAQYWIDTSSAEDGEVEHFGGKIQTSLLPLSFNDVARDIGGFTLHVKKSVPDYQDWSGGGEVRHNYIFGFRDINIGHWIYEQAASMITSRITLPEELVNEQYIDAVSIDVKDNKPLGSSIDYYVAADNGDLANPNLSSFDWKRIVPIEERVSDDENIVRFNGAFKESRFVRRDPTGLDYQLAPLGTDNVDISKRNPSQVIVPGFNIYTISDFDETYVEGTLELEEGVDTSKVMAVSYDDSMIHKGLSFWTDYVRGSRTPLYTTYQDIRFGSDFFYGGALGSASRSVYVETYVDCEEAFENQVVDFVKDQPNTTMWDVKVFLNGLELTHLGPGDDSDALRYNFKKGLNHIVMLINIPPNSISYPNVYVGSIKLMNSGALQNYGNVRLSVMKNVDFFDLKYNYSDNSNIFCHYQDRLITPKVPINNYRVSYVKSTSSAPTGIRLRADFRRDSIYPEVSPYIDSYRIRFAY